MRAASVEVDAFDRRVRALDLRALILAKKAAGRPKDLLVLPELEGLSAYLSGTAISRAPQYSEPSISVVYFPISSFVNRSWPPYIEPVQACRASEPVDAGLQTRPLLPRQPTSSAARQSRRDCISNLEAVLPPNGSNISTDFGAKLARLR